MVDKSQTPTQHRSVLAPRDPLVQNVPHRKAFNKEGSPRPLSKISVSASQYRARRVGRNENARGMLHAEEFPPHPTELHYEACIRASVMEKFPKVKDSSDMKLVCTRSKGPKVLKHKLIPERFFSLTDDLPRGRHDDRTLYVQLYVRDEERPKRRQFRRVYVYLHLYKHHLLGTTEITRLSILRDFSYELGCLQNRGGLRNVVTTSSSPGFQGDCHRKVHYKSLNGTDAQTDLKVDNISSRKDLEVKLESFRQGLMENIPQGLERAQAYSKPENLDQVRAHDTHSTQSSGNNPPRMPENMPPRMPENMPFRMPENMPPRMPENIPLRMSENNAHQTFVSSPLQPLPTTSSVLLHDDLDRQTLRMLSHIPLDLSEIDLMFENIPPEMSEIDQAFMSSLLQTLPVHPSTPVPTTLSVKSHDDLDRQTNTILESMQVLREEIEKRDIMVSELASNGDSLEEDVQFTEALKKTIERLDKTVLATMDLNNKGSGHM